MEYVVLFTTLLIVILQFVIMANQKKNAKKIDELMSIRRNAGHSDRDRSRDRNNENQRQQRRKKQDHRSKQPNASSGNSGNANENVEKSLRDINLKLKSVERDQDAARRQIQENSFGKDSQKRRGGRGNRNDRRDNRRDRGNRNNNWRDRKGSDTPKATNNEGGEPAPAAPEQPVTMQVADNAPQINVSQSLPDLNPVDFDTESTEHGRKFSVKRRVLKDEAGETPKENLGQVSDAGEITESSSDNATEAVPAENSEISFGRR
ncbi:MAG: hypothetical protein OQK82_05435 [Candidatus Pacearchaeota archaeon]|nr:hypothetical protein [Candidatus Pacearchaeota archaeon]